ncbi:hypothetical protein [Nocardia sp. NRRL S-836]|uniref:hypothetical protein n=1 Tax=Nocardia sp. NRRL S-836 TaxID=1519492 RepID=UPI0006C4D993|nr:hypothetical protein [Nocardia sp. NRRL S-836]KOV82567.1 hypothetical protein ADL03_24000 [Nocardia sp. NRRL S-836]
MTQLNEIGPSSTEQSVSATWQINLAGNRQGAAIEGPQKQFFRPVATEGLCGAADLSAYSVSLTPDRQVIPHYHEDDRIVVMRSGTAVTLLAAPDETSWEVALVSGPGDMIFIPAFWRHQAVCLHDVDALEISGDARFNHSVVLAPEFERPDLEQELRDRYSAGLLAPGAHPVTELARPREPLRAADVVG